MPSRPRLFLALSVCIATPALAQQVHHGLDPANLDTTCAPCQEFCGVSITPGQIALQRTSCGPSSSAPARIRPMTPCLAAV